MPGFRSRKKASGRTYYYFDTVDDAGRRREMPLGSNYYKAVEEWGRLAGKRSGAVDADAATFPDAARRYVKEVLPQKAERTRQDNLAELDRLLEFFGKPAAALTSIKPVHIRKYMDWRVDTTRKEFEEKNTRRVQQNKKPLPVPPLPGYVRANREKALFSHIFNAARNWGMTDAPNPCAGIKGYRETGRDHYVSERIYKSIYDAAEPLLQVAMEIAYRTGQRPGDVYRMRWSDIQTDAGADVPLLPVTQGKTRAKLRIRVEGALKAALQRAKELCQEGQRRGSDFVLTNKAGEQLDKQGIRGFLQRARTKAAKVHPDLAEEISASQFRDLRARAGTDVEEDQGISAARDLLGHTTEKMTRHYVRNRAGKIVSPVQPKSATAGSLREAASDEPVRPDRRRKELSAKD